MGLLDEVLAKVGKRWYAANANALSAITSYINSPQVGGWQVCRTCFEQGGLGHIVSSWIGIRPEPADYRPINSRKSSTAAPCSKPHRRPVWTPRSSPT